MRIDTKFLGKIEITDQDILTFEYGLLGFPKMKKYVILPIDAEHPLAILQSVEDSSLGFIIAYPFIFKPDYAFDISDEDKFDLQIDKEEDVLVYSIVTLKESFSNSTLNLLAPVVLNINRRLGKQIVLHDKAYPLRYPMQSLEGSVK